MADDSNKIQLDAFGNPITKTATGSGLGGLLNTGLAVAGGQLLGPALTNPNYQSAVNTLQGAQAGVQNTPLPSVQQLSYTPTAQTVVGQLNPTLATTVTQAPNAFNNITTNPAYTTAANNALGALQNIGSNGGLTATDQAQLNSIQENNATQARGANQAILQNAQQRGQAGSGVALLNQMLNQQNEATNNSNQGLGVAAQAQARALAAISGAGSLGAGLQAQSFGQQAQGATAANAINNWNASNGQQVINNNTNTENQAGLVNLGNEQQVSNNNATADTTAAKDNAATNQTLFNDTLNKNVDAGNVANNVATAQQGLGNAQTKSTADATSGLSNTLTAAGGAAGIFKNLSSLFDS